MAKRASTKEKIEGLVLESVEALYEKGYNEYSFKMGECVNFAVALGKVLESDSFLCVFDSEEDDPLHCYLAFNNWLFDAYGFSKRKWAEDYAGDWAKGEWRLIECFGYDSSCFGSLYEKSSSATMERVIRETIKKQKYSRLRGIIKSRKDHACL